jgi:hypothetical protein
LLSQRDPLGHFRAKKRAITEQYDESPELGNELMDVDSGVDEFSSKKQGWHSQEEQSQNVGVMKRR